MDIIPKRRENRLTIAKTGERFHIEWWQWLGRMFFLKIAPLSLVFLVGCASEKALGIASKVYENFVIYQGPVFDQAEMAANMRCEIKYKGMPADLATCMALIMDARTQWDAAIQALVSGKDAMTNALPEMSGALQLAREAGK